MRTTWDPQESTHSLIARLIRCAGTKGQQDAVARRLVALTLQMRFPELPIDEIQNSRTSDETWPSLTVRDTEFFVSSILSPALANSIRNCLDAGRRIYLLAPDETLEAARAWSESFSDDNVAVESIAGFVSLVIDKLSTFSTPQLVVAIERLINAYNACVEESGECELIVADLAG